MKVNKFGGASVRDTEGIRNLARIVSAEADNLVVVVSAFGKTTNALEKVLKAWLARDNVYLRLLEEIIIYHQSIINELFIDKTTATGKTDISFTRLKDYLLSEKRRDYDFEYDQVVSYGEIWSTIIVAEYLKTDYSDIEWIDIRENLLTDNRFRDAEILWSESTKRIRDIFNFKEKRIYVTQGFIGGTVT